MCQPFLSEPFQIYDSGNDVRLYVTEVYCYNIHTTIHESLVFRQHNLFRLCFFALRMAFL